MYAGPRILPCGTPAIVISGRTQFPSILTNCAWSEK